jgi:nucleosome binding factor SPN SPT16 subunit
MAEIKIDSKVFQERISHFVTAWKNDLRSKDGLFGGAQSMVVMMGKVEEIPEFHKNNAIHVCDPDNPRFEAKDGNADDFHSSGS